MFRKNILSLIIVLTMIASLVPATTVSATVNELFAIDFNEDVEYDAVDGKDGISYTVIDSEKGKSLAFSPKSAISRIEKDFDSPISDGIVRCSFEYFASEENIPWIKVVPYNSKYTSFVDQEKNVFASLMVDKEVISYYKNTKVWTVDENTMPTERNHWYSFDVYYDLEERQTHYVVDGEYLGSSGIHNDMQDIKGIFFMADGLNRDEVYIDNIKLSHMTDEDLVLLYKNGEAIPYVLASDVSFKYSTDAIGHIYYDKNKQEFKGILKNKTGEPKEAAIVYSIAGGEEKQIPVSLKPYERKEVPFYTSTDGYGFFDMSIGLTDGKGKVYAEPETTRISVVNAPPEGVTNPAMGTTIHATAGQEAIFGDSAVNMELAYRAGFSFVRNGIWWNSYEKQRGVYKFDEVYQKAVDKAKEIGMEVVPYFAFNNSIYNGEHPPHTPGELEAFANYAVHYVRDLKEQLGDLAKRGSTWNEWNVSAFNSENRPASEYATMMKYVYEAVKKEYPDFEVLGLVSSVDKDFIGGALDAGGANYMDYMDIHFYANKSIPDYSVAFSDFERLKDIKQSYGIEDMKVYLSEWGWSSVGEEGYADDMEQASYNVRFYLLNDVNDWFDDSAYYTFADGTEGNTQESRFGLIRPHNSEIPYEAKPSYLAIANYNAIMLGSEYVETIDCGNGTAAYRFKLADGRDCITAWTIDGRSDIGLKLGTDKVDVYDMYGNAVEYYAHDGVFTFGFDKDVNYIVGNFGEIASAKPQISIDKTEVIDIVSKNRSDINIKKADDMNIELKVDASDSLSVEENGTSSLTVTAGEAMDDQEIGITASENGKTVYKTKISVNYVDPVKINLVGIPYSRDQLARRMVNFEISTDLYEGLPAGTLKITGPEKFAKAARPVRLLPIKTGETRNVKVNVPQELSTENILLEATIEFDDGRKAEISRMTSFETCVYAENKPTIDGVVEKGEWERKTRMNMTDKGVVGNKYYPLFNLNAVTVYGGDEDLSGYAYTMWDETNFYLALEVRDNVWDYDRATKVLWRSDGIQLGLSPMRGSTTVVIAGLSNVGDGDQMVLDKSVLGASGAVYGAEYKIKREGNITTYEMRIPWEGVFIGDFDPIPNAAMAFSVLINDNDGNGRRGYLEYGSGIGNADQNSLQFMDLYLQGK